MQVRTTDYHTAGEPFRIVLEGAPELPGATVAERRALALESAEAQRLRRLLCHEPRGHADMYGGFLVDPDDAGAELGVLFWHKDGFSTACGHGTIALAAWAVESGRVEAPVDGEVELAVDVPSGRVGARVWMEGGAVAGVAFRNVPAYVIARGVEVETARGRLAVDVSYGGAIYASLPAADAGLAVVPAHLGELIALGRAIKWALNDAAVAHHPGDERLSGIYGTIFFDDLGPAHQRNVAIFADGRLPEGAVLRHESIVGTEFRARIVEHVVEEGRDAVVTEIEGAAHRTGEHRFVLDPRDPLGEGFVLR